SPTTPFENDRDAAHCTSAALSACSRGPNESHTPSLDPVPRTSTTTSAYPFAGNTTFASPTPPPDLPYRAPPKIPRQGHPQSGTSSSESSVTPSSIWIRTSDVVV